MEVSSVFTYDTAHSATAMQPLVSLGMLGTDEPRVAAAIHIMEQHIGDTLSIPQVAAQVDLSVRMLEYLFHADSRAVAGRLLPPPAPADRAPHGDRYARLELQEIALRTGFTSLSSFSRQFCGHYHRSPGECRRQARAVSI